MSGIKEKMVAGAEKLASKLPGHHGSAAGTHTAGTHTTGTHTTGTHTTGTHTGTHTGRLSDPQTGTLAGTTGTTGTTGYTTGTATGVGSGAKYESGSTGYGTTSTGATTGATGYGGTTGSTGHGTTKTGTTKTTTTSGGGACIPEKEIIDSKTFTKTTDEEVLIEKKKYELEHRPVQEEYVVETRKIGEKRVPGAATEVVGSDVREVEHRAVPHARGQREVVVEDVDVDYTTETRGYQTTGTRTTGTEYQTSGTQYHSSGTRTTGTGKSCEEGMTCYDNKTGREV